MSRHRVVVVGGGFGGIKAALDLYKDERFDVTLISDQLSFRYYPSLYRTATGGRRVIASLPISEIIDGKDIEFLHTKATKLNHQEYTITTSGGKVIHYDSLILALGVSTNYFNIKGLKEYSYGIKTLSDAEKLKRHLHQQMIEDKRPDLNYVVVGGGPTGVELAGALPSYLKKISHQHGIKRRKIRVELVEAAPYLVSRMPKDMSKRIARHLRKLGIKIYLSSRVMSQTDDSLYINNRKIDSETVVWTAGVSNNSFYEKNKFQLSEGGKVRVNQFLQAEKGIYVIGDNADTPYSGLAQTALYDAGFVASNLIRVVDKLEPIPYSAKKPIYVLPAGPKWAAVLWGNVRIYGLLGFWLRRLADLRAYHDYEPWQLASRRWMAEVDEEEHCSICSKQ